MNQQEKKIQTLENERRAIVEEMETEMQQKRFFFDGCKQTLLSIETDESQRKMVQERIMQLEGLLSSQLSEIKEKFETKLKPVLTELVGCYLSSGMK